MKYQVVECLFPALRKIIKKDLTHSEAEELRSLYNSDCDAYTFYEIEEMPLDIKKERKEKLNKINEIQDRR